MIKIDFFDKSKPSWRESYK